MSDDTTALLVNEAKNTTTEQGYPQPKQQPEQPQAPNDEEARRKTYDLWMKLNLTLFVANVMWATVYIIVFAITDPVTCTGRLYTFGSAARWVLLAFAIWDGICALILKWYRDHPDRGFSSACYRYINSLYYVGFLGFWVYSIIVIIFQREGCDGEILTRLLWNWVYTYAIEPLILCCLLTCACFGAIVLL